MAPNRPTPHRLIWAHAGPEPELDDMLADPIVHLVLKRDGLTRDDVVAVMRQARFKITRRELRAVA